MIQKKPNGSRRRITRDDLIIIDKMLRIGVKTKIIAAHLNLATPTIYRIRNHPDRYNHILNPEKKKQKINYDDTWIGWCSKCETKGLLRMVNGYPKCIACLAKEGDNEEKILRRKSRDEQLDGDLSIQFEDIERNDGLLTAEEQMQGLIEVRNGMFLKQRLRK